MDFSIKEITSQTEWQDFENKYSPNTFLQSWEWGESQKLLGNKIFRLGIYGDKLVGVAFVYKIIAKRGTFLFCPHGPLIDWQKGKEILPVLLAVLIELAKKEKVDFIRFSPLALNSEENKKIFINSGFCDAPTHMMHPELAWLLDLSLPEEEIFSSMAKRTRYSIRKAEKDGVSVVSENLSGVDKFYELYKETAQRQGFVPFSLDYVKKEFNIFDKAGKIKLYFANFHGEAVATAMIIFGYASAFYHHGASTRKLSNITASEMLQWTSIKEAKNRGLKYYNFWGIAPENSPKHPWFGLTQFKKGFGGFSEEYLHAQDFPITYKYWLNFIVEKVRKIKRGY